MNDKEREKNKKKEMNRVWYPLEERSEEEGGGEWSRSNAGNESKGTHGVQQEAACTSSEA